MNWGFWVFKYWGKFYKLTFFVSVIMIYEMPEAIGFRLCNGRALAKLKTKVLNLWYI